jgi:hypothetical protein
MIIETDDYGPVDIGDLSGEALAEAYAEAKARCDELEAIIKRHAAATAANGHDFTDTGHEVIVDREKDAAWRADALADLDEEQAARTGNPATRSPTNNVRPLICPLTDSLLAVTVRLRA